MRCGEEKGSKPAEIGSRHVCLCRGCSAAEGHASRLSVTVQDSNANDGGSQPGPDNGPSDTLAMEGLASRARRCVWCNVERMNKIGRYGGRIKSTKGRGNSRSEWNH